MKKSLVVVPLLAALLGQGCAPQPAMQTPTPLAPVPTPATSTPSASDPIREPEIVARDLEVPWDIAFLPAGDILVTERVGKVTGISRDGTKVNITGVPDVRRSGEGGLLGMLLHPNFANNKSLYLYLTFTKDGKATCRIDRFTLDGTTLTNSKTIIDDIPCAIYHDGGRMAWGPDGKLYVTTGDATVERNAQDKNSLSGEILRLNEDGSIPSDNPFGNAAWSYGHRNPQGITWDDQGRLWATEHGRSGITSGYDELNLIEKGANYGWPTIQGPEKRDGMQTPKLQSGSTSTWAPASALYWDHSIFFGGLQGTALYEADITQDPPVLKTHFKGQYGRIRTVTLGPDGMFYLTTSNRDGRGSVMDGDDKIIRIDPRMFRK